MGAGTYTIGAAAFALLLFALLYHWDRRFRGILALLACVATVAWTGTAAVSYWTEVGPPEVVALLELLRSIGWLVFLGAVLYSGHPRTAARFAPEWVVPLTGLSAIVVLVAGTVVFKPSVTGNPTPILGLVLAVTGLLLTEILARNTPSSERWMIKFLCLGTGVIFTYDLFLYADATLFHRPDPVLQEARGAVQALAAPLFAIAAARNKLWRTNISISRQVVLGSTTFIAGGIYLLLAAAAGLVLREMDEVRGPVVQVIFFAGALAVLAIVLSSGAFWAHAKVFISRHFYQHKYDWREEWLRFMQTVSAGQTAAPLEERCVQAIADVVESPGGAMWLLEGNRYECACSWNLGEPNYSEELDGPLSHFLAETRSVIDLDQVDSGAAAHSPVDVPVALKEIKRAWLIVPLWHRVLVGFVVLARPRAGRGLGWEDYELLRIVGRHVASYVAEQRAVEQLEDAREFEIFNRRFAFVVHDVKNLLSQLSVLASNFEKYGHKSEFRDDVVTTLNDASKKMKRLMDRIHAFEPAKMSKDSQSLEPLIRRVVSAQSNAQVSIDFQYGGPGLEVAVDPDRLEAVIGHLIRNAVEAVNGAGNVKIALGRSGRFAILDIVDQGPGMDSEFIRRELFKPFQSTKRRGMGIGAYQCREYARELGGNLEAISSPGAGTTMRMTLPVAGDRPASVGERSAHIGS